MQSEWHANYTQLAHHVTAGVRGVTAGARGWWATHSKTGGVAPDIGQQLAPLQGVCIWKWLAQREVSLKAILAVCSMGVLSSSAGLAPPPPCMLCFVCAAQISS